MLLTEVVITFDDTMPCWIGGGGIDTLRLVGGLVLVDDIGNALFD